MKINKHNTKLLGVLTLLVLIGGIIAWQILHYESQKDKNDTPMDISKSQSQSDTDFKPSKSSFNKEQYSISDPTSIWVIVNKQRTLDPADYAPNDLVIPSIPLRSGRGSSEMLLRDVTAKSLEQMASAASSEGINLMLASGYRSYALQVAVYGNEVKTYGQAQADAESARPGHSEHQTGFAADLEPSSRECEVAACFANTKEGKWLAENSYKYGFVIRYPQNKQQITGYIYEPWHVRYVGIELAKQIHETGLTLEQFFGLPDAPQY